MIHNFLSVFILVFFVFIYFSICFRLSKSNANKSSLPQQLMLARKGTHSTNSFSTTSMALLTQLYTMYFGAVFDRTLVVDGRRPFDTNRLSFLLWYRILKIPENVRLSKITRKCTLLLDQLNCHFIFTFLMMVCLVIIQIVRSRR
jgi:hypothetical protein